MTKRLALLLCAAVLQMLSPASRVNACTTIPWYWASLDAPDSPPCLSWSAEVVDGPNNGGSLEAALISITLHNECDQPASLSQTPVPPGQARSVTATPGSPVAWTADPTEGTITGVLVESGTDGCEGCSATHPALPWWPMPSVALGLLWAAGWRRRLTKERV